MLELETEHIQALGFILFIGLFSHQMMRIDNPRVSRKAKFLSVVSCSYSIYAIVNFEKISTLKQNEYLPLEWMGLTFLSLLIFISLFILTMKKTKI